MNTSPLRLSPLAGHLLEASRWHADKFFENFDPDATQMIASQQAMHAGSCIELYSKFAIACQHPLLVFQSELSENQAGAAFAMGVDITVEKASGGNWRSIGANRAVVMVEASTEAQSLPGTRILRVRNGAAHLGYCDVSMRALGGDLTDWLMVAIGASGLEMDLYRKTIASGAVRSTFLRGKAESVCREYFDGRVGDLITQIDAHRKEYENELKRVMGSKNTRDQAIEMVKSKQDPSLMKGDDYAEAPCPACGNEASFHRVVVDMEVEYERSGDHYSYPIYKEWFYCPWCQLKLEEAQVQILPLTGLAQDV